MVSIFIQAQRTTQMVNFVYFNEGNPIAFLAEQAGGIASDGYNRILDIQPTELHQRVPLFVGSAEIGEKSRRNE